MADYKLSAMHDIHTHLYWKSYDEDRDLVVRRAREAGVDKMLVIGCTVDESREAIAVAEQYPNMYASIGIHPNEVNHEAGSMKQEWVQELRKLAEHPKVMAIGECGLDYFRRDGEKSITVEEKHTQKEAFLKQISLAQEQKLSVIVHCRNAYDDMFEILSANYSQFIHHASYFILHCYMGDTEVTEKFLTLPNVYFSFTGNITYPVKKAVAGTKDDLTETVKMIPLDRIFTETDCPFLTPQSHRGERNEPAYVPEVLECIARLHGVEPKAVEELTESNFKKAFPMVQ